MQAKQGDRVKVHYLLKDANGNTVESTYEQESPIEFILGDDRVIKGFANNVAGMTVGEKKTAVIPPAEGYGYHNEEKVFEFDRSKAPEDFDPPLGHTMRMHRPDGQAVVVTVIDRTDKGFLMDANHPLAGKELIFELEMVDIIPG